MGHVNNLEANLNLLNGRFININDKRSEFTSHYNELRNQLYSTIKTNNQVLGKLLKGHKLEGSYGDNLKVTRPDEFDLVIQLAFPENDYIIVKADPRRPGNVTLDMTQVMERIRNQEHNKLIYEQLQKIVNARNMLLENELQSWLHSQIAMSINKMNGQINVNGHISKLVYKRSGPAHTIYVEEPYKYSVDFVPSIRLSVKQIVLEPKQREYFGKTEFWNAIPKPLKGQQGDNISFRASFFDAEHKLLNDKGNLKNGIRMMKKFRDTKQNMGNLKSYYIKTLFLWQVVEQEPNYWNKQLNAILTDMFGKLSECLKTGKKNGKLPFFWDPKLDMFADFTDRQRIDMFNCTEGSGAYILRMASGNANENNIENVISSFCNPVERGICQSKKQDNKTKSIQTEKPPQCKAKAQSTPAGQNNQSKKKTEQPVGPVKSVQQEKPSQTGARPKTVSELSKPVTEQNNTQAKPQPAKEESKKDSFSCKLS